MTKWVHGDKWQNESIGWLLVDAWCMPVVVRVGGGHVAARSIILFSTLCFLFILTEQQVFINKEFISVHCVLYICDSFV